jgi:thiamine-phosphate pyrophosphorylase
MRHQSPQTRARFDAAFVLEPNVIWRILDANFNRSREALRAMEEFARLILDDASLTAAIKTTRHDLTSPVSKLVASLNASANQLPNHLITTLPNHRDILGDVGTEISTPTEAKRADAQEVLVASCKRLTESLRALEEYGKVIDPAFAARVEQLRYRAYELERRLFATIRASENFASVRLYVLITESLCSADWFDTARAALAGGVDCLQLREKNLPDRQLLDRAKRLAQICRDMEKIFIVNDRPDIALAASAHGVHLGQEDLPVAAARRILPAHMIVGLSTHTIEQIESAIAVAPDYIAVGPMFDSPTKPQPHVAGHALLAEARKRTALPLVAIGGIDERNISSVLAAAPACVCVCRAIIAQPDPAAAAKNLRTLLCSPPLSASTP